MKPLLLLFLLASCATPQAAYRRKAQADLVTRLQAYPEGAHVQRCEEIQASFDRCAKDDHPREDCGYDPFEIPRQAEPGCGFVK